MPKLSPQKSLKSHHFRILVVKKFYEGINPKPLNWNTQQRYAVGISKLQTVSSFCNSEMASKQPKREHYTSATASGKNFMSKFNILVSMERKMNFK